MKQVWFAIPMAAGAIALLAAAAPDEKQPESWAKLGLWAFERHSNVPMFLAGSFKTPEEAAARSAEMLKLSGMKRELCVSGEVRKKTLERPPMTGPCALPPPKFENGRATLDGTCDGRTFHSVLTAGPDNRVTSMHAVISDTADPQRGSTIDALYESNEHVTFTITLNRQENGVHMIDVWDYRWVSADCGALKPGESRPLAK